MKQLASVAAILMLLSACSAQREERLETVTPAGVGIDAAKLSQVDGIFESAIADNTIPGAVFAVVRHGKIACTKVYGNKSVVPDTVALTKETMFDLASCSKCVGTTLSFMQLVENGQVCLTDKVSRYIPEFRPWVDPDTGEKVEITVQQLLTHSSGLDPYISMDSFVKEYGESTPATLMKHIAAKVGRNFRPGSDFMYSCLNFVTLQNILQKVTGERLCDYAQKNVFDALRLKHTCYFPLDGKPSCSNQKTLAALCAPSEVQEDGLPLTAKVHDPLARIGNLGNSGNAGVFSNIEDMCTIAACLMNGGEWNGHRILSTATVRRMLSVPEEDDPKVGRALGWDCCSSYSGPKGDILSRHNSFMHTGYTGPSIVLDLDNDVAVIILACRCHPQDKGSLGRLRAQVANVVAGSIID
jgi:Beta-lactamase class C and other penicillin binding proteins